MFAGMTLGIGVDFAIHLVERYRLAIKRGPRSDPALTDEEIASSSASREARTRAALTEALSTAGPAILIDGVAIALGFGVLLLSQVPANSRLGELVMISIFNCMLFTLILLPAVVPSAASERPGGND